ncbi:GHKL domain-containing protein, partial [Paraclostridium sordellii]
DNRYINIRGTIVKSYYIIKCENSKNNEIKIKNKKILTNKKDKFLHGLGLTSMKSSLNKYNGDLKFIDEENKFIINIYIPLD